MKENQTTCIRGLYEAPDCTSVKIKTDGMLCQSPIYGLRGAPGAAPGLDDEENNYGDF